MYAERVLRSHYVCVCILMHGNVHVFVPVHVFEAIYSLRQIIKARYGGKHGPANGSCCIANEARDILRDTQICILHGSLAHSQH